jgi:tetratricopeptide (TPR) repeat protein
MPQRDPVAERLLRIKKRLIDNLGADRPEFNEAVEKWFDAATGVATQMSQWTSEARACEAAGEWAGAEAKYKQILALPDLAQVHRYKAHADLSALCALLARHAEALEHAHQATAAARAEQMDVLVGMALRGEVIRLLQVDRAAQALPLVEESLAHLGDDSKFGLLRARHFVLRAGCRQRLAEYDEAQRDLDRAFVLYRPRDDDAIAIGVQSDLATAWSIQARLRTAAGDADGAIDAWRKAVEKARFADESPLPNASSVHSKSAIALMLGGLAEALAAAGDLESAAAARTEREDVLRAIGLGKEN